jgi:Skp family chaperone for outer membrane proteins
MTRTNLIALFADAAQDRKGLVQWLKDADAYHGVSRLPINKLREHATTVYAALVRAEEADAKKAEAKPEPKAKKAPAKKRTLADRDEKAVKRYTRDPRAATVRKMATAIANTANAEGGTVVLDAEALTLAGLGKAWAKVSNDFLGNPAYMHAKTLALCGYTGRTTRGTLVLTPITEQAAEEVA